MASKPLKRVSEDQHERLPTYPSKFPFTLLAAWSFYVFKIVPSHY